MSGRLLRVGVLVSGAGTVLQSLIDACRSGEVPAQIAVVVSNAPGAFALERARAAGVPALEIDHRRFAGRPAFDEALRRCLEEARVDLVVLAGFLRILTPAFAAAYAGRIMNIHPALLPAFGGKGMYGDRVHEAVLASGARVSGCTVHFVTGETDAGPIIAQAAVPVEDDDTPATLSARVRREELRLYPLAVRLFAEERLRIEGNRVRVLRPAAGRPGRRAPGAPGVDQTAQAGPASAANAGDAGASRRLVPEGGDAGASCGPTCGPQPCNRSRLGPTA